MFRLRSWDSLTTQALETQICDESNITLISEKKMVDNLACGKLVCPESGVPCHPGHILLAISFGLFSLESCCLLFVIWTQEEKES